MIAFINCYEEMATGMRLLAAMAREKGHEVHIIVLRGYTVKVTSELDETNSSMHVLVNGELHVNPLRTRKFTAAELRLLCRKLAELNPDLVCVSTRSANDPIMPAILHASRDTLPSVPILCGGYGPTYAPQYYLEQGADMVIRGEGEIAFMDLLAKFKGEKLPQDVPNACFMRDKRMICNPMAPPLRNITGLPSPLVGDEFVTFIDENDAGIPAIAEHDPAYDNATFCVLVGRGCVGKCSYCAAPVQKNMYAGQGHCMPSYRRRTYQQVFQELEAAKARGIKQIFFKDEYLVDVPEQLAAFFEEYKQRIDLPFKANLHFGQLLKSPRLLRAVMDAGIINMTLGFQAGTEAMAKKIYGRPHNFADLRKLADIMYEACIPVQYHFVSGTTLNTEEEFQDKCNLVASLPYDPLLPWRATLFDFQFFPQPQSLMTVELGAGKLKRLPARQWATRALAAQLWHFASPEDAAQTWDEARKQPDPVAFLITRSEQLRKKAWQSALHNLTAQLHGRNMLVMGEATPDFKNLAPFFDTNRIVGHIGFPGYPLEKGRIDFSQITTSYGGDIPVLLFGSAAYKFMRTLKSQKTLKNPVFGIAQFIERFK